MKRLITLILILLISQTSHACTIVMASKDGVVLAGNNEDWKDPFTSIWFIPASGDEYGRVCFGFGNSMQNPQGGMNEHGVFIDGNALSPTGWKTEEGKSTFFGHVIDHVLAHCANVEDATAFSQ